MSTREEHGASGTLVLFDKWYETSGTEYEETHKAQLEGNEKEVVLTEFDEEYDVRKAKRSHTIKHSIGVQELIQLIRNHGRKT